MREQMTQKLWLFGIAGLLLVVLLIAGPQVRAASHAQDLPPDHPNIEEEGGIPERPSAGEGQAIYAESCAPCHGPTGQGDGPTASSLPNPPTAFADPANLRNLPPSQIFKITKEGRIERGMPPWKNRLSDSAIWSVTAYLFDLNISNEEYQAGQAVYQKSCQSCHGPTGKGDGPEAGGLNVPDLTIWTNWVDVSNEEWVSRVLGDEVHMAVLGDVSREEVTQAIAYVRTLTYSSTRAPLTGNGVISGTVEMMTPDETANFEGLEVILFGFRGSMDPRLILTTTVSATNTFRFEGLSTDPDALYTLRTEWEGATYGSGVLVFPPDQTVITTTLQVAATTDQNPGVRADQVHWFVDFGDGVINVGELISISNPGKRTYIGEPIPGQEDKRAVIRWPLPANATNITVEGGQIGERYLLIDGALVDTSPLPPGADVRRLLFQYQIPLDNGRVQIEHPVGMPIRFLSLFVVDLGQQVEVPENMIKGETQDVSGVPVATYLARDLQPGQTLNIRMSKIPKTAGTQAATQPASESPIRLIGIAMAAILGLALFGGMFYLGRHTPPTTGPGREALVAQRDALLQEIAVLDERYERQEIDEATYRQERDLLMAEAVRLTLRLEEDKDLT